ncbi:hypothetical protein RHMOL_Rhmol06G0277000 [Rhododendron molle]|uniref:Uncharacterized protein n=1 Tax=Rhododendron molle TaxID=49168 RepID=A0ACC0NJ02_RHOML|nr:hypothetical protein RHMOL_Rhmol06G0277000 [Rhododendron molle]
MLAPRPRTFTYHPPPKEGKLRPSSVFVARRYAIIGLGVRRLGLARFAPLAGFIFLGLPDLLHGEQRRQLLRAMVIPKSDRQKVFVSRWLAAVWRHGRKGYATPMIQAVCITLEDLLVFFCRRSSTSGSDRICLTVRRLDGGAGLSGDAYGVLCGGGYKAG